MPVAKKESRRDLRGGDMANIIELGQITEDDISAWMSKYEKRENGYYCKRCGSRVRQTTCNVSIHLDIFELKHADYEKECHLKYPYCPVCDGAIHHATACFHIGREVYDMISSDPGEKWVTKDI